MKRKALRVGLVLVVLGAIAAIPASTQMTSGEAENVAGRDGRNLSLLVAVNRLELSRAQMETLRDVLRGLVDGHTAIETQRTAFVDEMIAFRGTAAELDARVAVFEGDMKAARAALRDATARAVDVLKTTLSMKQGEMLLESFPMFGAALGASQPANEAVRQALGVDGQGGLRASIAIGAVRAGVAAQGRGIVAWDLSDDETPGAAARARIATAVDRLRDRLADRLADASAGLEPRAMQRMRAASERREQAETPAKGEMVWNAGSISLAPDKPVAKTERAVGVSTQWLVRLLEVLELKLAAMP